jgi:hypothetical protein
MVREDIRKKTNADRPRRRSNRHRAVAIASPRNFEDMLKEAESIARESIYAGTCVRKPKHKGPPFQLLDLPPDIRIRIFEYMVFRPYPLPLLNLVAPLITTVSKQVRAECMASFFALNTFQIVVETNICLNPHIVSLCKAFGSMRAARQSRNLNNNGRHYINLLCRLEPVAGAIRILPSTNDRLDKISDKVAVFQDIQLIRRDVFNHPTLELQT